MHFLKSKSKSESAIFDPNEEIERVSNGTGELTEAGGLYDNAYYVQDGAYFEAGISYHY